MNKEHLLIGVTTLLLGFALGAFGVSLVEAEEDPQPISLRDGDKNSDRQKGEDETPKKSEQPRRPNRDNDNEEKPKPVEPDVVENNPTDNGHAYAPPSIAKASGAISGTVFGAENQPFAGAKIIAEPIYSSSSGSGSSLSKADIQRFVSEATLETLSDSSGSYSFKDLYDLKYKISCEAKGYKPTALSTSQVKAGGSVDFAFQELHNLVIHVRLPDGKAPDAAKISINSAASNNYNRYYNNAYSKRSSMLAEISYAAPGYGGGWNYSGGQGGKTFLWTPEKPSTELSPGIWRISANINNYEMVSDEVNVNALGNEEVNEITLQLREMIVTRIKLQTEDPDIAPNKYQLHLRPLAAGELEYKNFGSVGRYVSHSSDGVFLDKKPESGTQILSIVLNGEIVAEKNISQSASETKQITVVAPGPLRADYVVVELEGLDMHLRSRAYFYTGYTSGKKNPQKYQGNVIRRPDGTVWVPHYGSKDPNKPDPASAEHFVQATVNGVGSARATYFKSGASSARLTFAEPGTLKVQFTGFDANNDTHKKATVTLKRIYRDGEPKNGGSVGQTGRVDDFGTLYVTGVAPGDYDITVTFNQTSYNSNAKNNSTRRITVRSGLNEVSERLPPLYKLSITVPSGIAAAKRYPYIQLKRSNRTVKWMRIVENQKLDLGQFPAGEYVVQIGYSSKSPRMTFQLGSDLSVHFAQEN